MAEEENLDWGPNINYNIYEDNYRLDLIHKLRRIVGPNTQTTFIRRNRKKYFSATLNNNKNQGLLCHIKEEDLYVTAMSKREGGRIYRFDDKDFDDFGTDAEKVGFSGNYNKLTKGLGEDIYTISYKKLEESVDFLIGEMYSTKTGKTDKNKWKRSMFTIILALGEGGRNNIISSSYAKSQRTQQPSKIPGPWVNYVILNWSAFTKSALLCENQNITLQDLTPEEKEMLYAASVPADSYLEHFKNVKANHRVCRVMLAILCKQKPT